MTPFVLLLPCPGPWQRNLAAMLSELAVHSCTSAAIVGRWLLLGASVHGAGLSAAYSLVSDLAWAMATVLLSGGEAALAGLTTSGRGHNQPYQGAGL